jgi:hypothetical protein
MEKFKILLPYVIPVVFWLLIAINLSKDFMDFFGCVAMSFFGIVVWEFLNQDLS